jgi:hypothetical protein
VNLDDDRRSASYSERRHGFGCGVSAAASGDTEDYPADEVQEMAQLVASEVAASVWSVEDEKEADNRAGAFRAS